MRARDEETTAVRLAVAVTRLKARLREASLSSAPALSLSQMSILQYLRSEGPATAAAIAVAEHVSQQAIAQNLFGLKRDGLVRTKRDATDRRRIVITITKAGLDLFATATASREAWLAQAIHETVAARERAALDKAIDLLERLAGRDR